MRMGRSLAIATLLCVASLTACSPQPSEPTREPPVADPTPATSKPAPTKSAAVELAEGDADVACAVEGDTILVDAKGKATALASGAGPTILIAPQVGERLCDMDAEAREFNAAGYRTVQVDVDMLPVATLVAVAEWSRETSDEPLGLLGASRGATDVLAATPEISPDAVVALSPPTMFSGADALAAMPNNDKPTLIVVGANDSRFTGPADRLVEAGGSNVQLVVAPDTSNHGHAFLLADSPQRQVIVDFLQEHLLSP